MRLVSNRDAVQRDIRSSEDLKSQALCYLARIRRVDYVISQSLRLGLIVERRKAIKKSDRILFRQPVVISDAAVVGVRINDAGLRKWQKFLGPGHGNRPPRAGLISDLGNQRVAIAGPHRRIDTLIRRYRAANPGNPRAERSPNSRRAQSCPSAKSKLRLG